MNVGTSRSFCVFYFKYCSRYLSYIILSCKTQTNSREHCFAIKNHFKDKIMMRVFRDQRVWDYRKLKGMCAYKRNKGKQPLGGNYHSVSSLKEITWELAVFSKQWISFSHPLLISNLCCLMDFRMDFLRMLAVLSETYFCKVPTLYDITNCFKLHSRSFGMDPSVSVIIDPINISLSTL